MSNKRAIYLLVVFGLMFLTLIGYITYLEIYHADEYTASTYNPRNYELDRKVIRGSVYDRNNVELAFSEKITQETTETVDGITKTKTVEKIVRRYPYNGLYAHVIGYVSEDYSNRTLIENVYNSDLIESNILSKISDELKYGERRGKNIYLTIDHNLQQVAYKALGNNDGAIIALNPKTGEILAMVSKPDFDPNPGMMNLDELKDTALFSRAIQMPYPPGSTYKIITTAAALQNGLEDLTYDDTTGEYVIESSDGNEKNNYVCKNVNSFAYGLTDLENGLRVSSNVYFSHLGVTLGTDALQNCASQFLLNKNLKKELDFDLPLISSSFQKGDMTKAERAMSSIGQGQTEMTPMHMALVVSAIANNGVMPKPYIVSKVGMDDVLGKGSDGIRILDQSTAATIKDMLLTAVENGTGSTAKINGIKVCGKTGTSENSVTAVEGLDSDKTHALFVGFAPYEDPEIAICVVVEHAGFGSSKAAPIAKSVMEKYLTSK